MSKANQASNKGGKSNNGLAIAIGLAVVLVAGFLVIKSFSGNAESTTSGGDLVITKSEVTGQAKFYPYTVGKTKMEVIAVKANDGSIRTAFNTCQVCFSSGKGYYKQEGNELVCQNCGNRFKIEQVEKIKGGCNPVPIMKENKTDDGTSITISQAYLEQAKDLFASWKE